jgi:hypothetical protein
MNIKAIVQRIAASSPDGPFGVRLEQDGVLILHKNHVADENVAIDQIQAYVVGNPLAGTLQTVQVIYQTKE